MKPLQSQIYALSMILAVLNLSACQTGSQTSQKITKDQIIEEKLCAYNKFNITTEGKVICNS